MDIRVNVNNKDLLVPEGTTVNNLLGILNYNTKVGVWVNGTQLLSSDYTGCTVCDEDKIKINRIVAGG